ncbi:unnamed protein product [Bathycoccus prasinos]
MCVYEGEVLEKTTKAEGSGIMRFASGDWYEGRFAQGKPDGKGKLSFSRRRILRRRVVKRETSQRVARETTTITGGINSSSSLE